jgi:hypothetical protein
MNPVFEEFILFNIPGHEIIIDLEQELRLRFGELVRFIVIP